MERMFCGCSLFESFFNISKWKSQNVKEMSNKFIECPLLSSNIDIGKQDTKNLKIHNNIFDESEDDLFVQSQGKYRK